MILRGLTVGILQENCYILGCEETGVGVVIDPGDDAHSILAVVRRLQLTVEKILNTHAHFDHVMAVNQLKAETGATFHLHAADLPLLRAAAQQVEAWLNMEIDPVEEPDGYLVHGQTIRVGGETLEVRHVPGHAPGHVVFVDHKNRQIFGGDTLFQGSIGRFDLPGADGPTLLQAIREQLLTLPDDYQVYPGHGEPTTIGDERVHNPYVGQQAQYSIQRQVDRP